MQNNNEQTYKQAYTCDNHSIKIVRAGDKYYVIVKNVLNQPVYCYSFISFVSAKRKFDKLAAL